MLRLREAMDEAEGAVRMDLRRNLRDERTVHRLAVVTQIAQNAEADLPVSQFFVGHVEDEGRVLPDLRRVLAEFLLSRAGLVAGEIEDVRADFQEAGALIVDQRASRLGARRGDEKKGADEKRPSPQERQSVAHPFHMRLTLASPL